MQTITIPDICLWGTHLAEHPKHVRLGDTLVARYGPHKGVPCKVVRIEWREEMYKGAPLIHYYFYCNRI